MAKRSNSKLICAFCGAREGDEPGVIFAQSGYEGLAICSNCLRQGYHALCAGEKGETAGAVDVQIDILLRILRLEEEQLGNHQIGDLIVDRSAEKNDPVLEQPAVDVESAFPLAGLLNHHRNQKRVAFHQYSSLLNVVSVS